MSEVIAVIPTYNSETIVPDRVNELLKSSFEKIVVCDDNSEDNTLGTLSKAFGSRIKVLGGDKNLGPGGNRNRILTTHIGREKLLLFLDADCQVEYSGDLARFIQSSFEDATIGVVGYGITNKTGVPMAWNYGELMHPVHEAADQRLEEMLKTGSITEEQFKLGAPARAASFRMFGESEPKEVGWVAEGCFAVRAGLFYDMGGFAPAMRYHETHDFNARIQKAGFKTIFNPTTVATHLSFDSRLHHRKDDERLGRLYYYQRHWGMSEEVFCHLFDEK